MSEPTDRAPSARGKELIAGILLAALIATLAIRNLVPADALAPAIVTLLFAVAAVTAGVALALPAATDSASCGSTSPEA